MAVEPEGLPRVAGEEDQEDQREVEKIPVNVLNDERKGALAKIFFAGFADGARGRIGPKRFVVSAAIVITGEPEATGGPKDEHGAGNPQRNPGGLGAKPGGLRITKKFGGIKRGDIGAKAEILSVKRSPKWHKR